eukprot:CAMPEP_0115036694 /NCGR_PEP_ID=MMETSP0216-20121206/42282_1 /TAXON_ID=223996 /ORGANISM="Protocruzia adherens, Strain Boccale" /LENGTH=134 /DNA_ID=CAMNT_0002416585 /DNA_START=1 /DNA_END=405 /DNA_ORIENTATION=+
MVNQNQQIVAVIEKVDAKEEAARKAREEQDAAEKKAREEANRQEGEGQEDATAAVGSGEEEEQKPQPHIFPETKVLFFRYYELLLAFHPGAGMKMRATHIGDNVEGLREAFANLPYHKPEVSGADSSKSEFRGQ